MSALRPTTCTGWTQRAWRHRIRYSDDIIIGDKRQPKKTTSSVSRHILQSYPCTNVLTYVNDALFEIYIDYSECPDT